MLVFCETCTRLKVADIRRPDPMQLVDELLWFTRPATLHFHSPGLEFSVSYWELGSHRWLYLLRSVASHLMANWILTVTQKFYYHYLQGIAYPSSSEWQKWNTDCSSNQIQCFIKMPSLWSLAIVLFRSYAKCCSQEAQAGGRVNRVSQFHFQKYFPTSH